MSACAAQPRSFTCDRCDGRGHTGWIDPDGELESCPGCEGDGCDYECEGCHGRHLGRELTGDRCRDCRALAVRTRRIDPAEDAAAREMWAAIQRRDMRTVARLLGVTP